MAKKDPEISALVRQEANRLLGAIYAHRRLSDALALNEFSLGLSDGQCVALGIDVYTRAEFFLECLRRTLVDVHRKKAGIDELLDIMDNRTAKRLACNFPKFRALVARTCAASIGVIRMEWDEQLFLNTMSLAVRMDPRITTQEMGSTDTELSAFSIRAHGCF